jgi:hypothetical protein
MKNLINIHNYEAFLLDHMEGNLSTEDIVALQMFAAQNPHLNIDLNDRELVELSAEEISFNAKENLKKPLVSDEQFVAYVENELNAKEKQNIDQLCASNEVLAKELKLYKKSFVIPDEKIVFENKSQLKKQETKVLWFYPREVFAAAASLILILGLWFIFRNFNSFDSNLNSEKIKGNIKVKTFALKNNSSAPSFTSETTKHNIVMVNPMVYSKTVEIVPQNDNTTSITSNVPKENKEEAPKEIITSNNNKENDPDNNPSKFASTNVPATKQYIITEKAFDEDEKAVAPNEKKSFWSKATKVLNGLNKLGVKKTKGTETTENNNEQYVLTMGNLKVEKNKFNAE